MCRPGSPKKQRRDVVSKNSIVLPDDNIHAACQDQNCSAATIRKLIVEGGIGILETKDVFGRVVSVVNHNAIFCLGAFRGSNVHSRKNPSHRALLSTTHF